MSDIVWHYLPEVPPEGKCVYLATATVKAGPVMEIDVILAVHAPYKDLLPFRPLSDMDRWITRGAYAWAEIVIPAAPPLERER